MPPSESPPSFLRRWWRRLYWLPRDWRRLHRLPWRHPALFVGFGGIGDEFLTTALIHALYEQTGRPIDVHARHPGLFQNNPGVRRILKADAELLETAATWQADLRRPCEWQREFDSDRQEPPLRHIIVEAAAAGKLHGQLELRPHLQLTPAELAAPVFPPAGLPLVAIQSSGSAARYFLRNKEWGSTRFQAVVDALGHRFQFVQLGSAEDPPLRGTVDRRGACTLRESAAILTRAQFFIGQVGFLMHLNRAVNRRAVIVCGGRELPWQSGYPCNENLVNQPPCSPCWQKNECAFDRICLSRITPADVVAAVDRILSRLDQDIEVTLSEL